jgi:hypothetical protein
LFYNRSYAFRFAASVNHRPARLEKKKHRATKRAPLKFRHLHYSKTIFRRAPATRRNAPVDYGCPVLRSDCIGAV